MNIHFITLLFVNKITMQAKQIIICYCKSGKHAASAVITSASPKCLEI